MSTFVQHHTDADLVASLAQWREFRKAAVRPGDPCVECDGDGTVGRWLRDTPKNRFVRETCDDCGGSGVTS